MSGRRLKGAVRVEAIERRFALRLRVRIPDGGLTRLGDIHAWLDARVGRLGYRIWGDRHAPWDAPTTAVFLDDAGVAADLVAAFGLELAADHGARAHASDDRP
jgi:hypothetical protein